MNDSDIDVLLVLPPMYHSGRIPDYNPKEPMGLMYLTAVLRRDGYKVSILDADVCALTIEQTVREIAKRQAKIIGFSVIQRALPSVKLIAEKLRKRGISSHICCGGFAATLGAKHILERISAIDSIILGEGEMTFSKLVKAIVELREWKHLPGLVYREDHKIIFNQPAVKPDLGSLPWPSRDLLQVCFEKTNYATILASRGCYGICTFCSNLAFEQATIGSNWRGRDPIDVVNEIEDLKKSYGVKVFKLNDPNMFGSGSAGHRHLLDICSEIIRREIKDLHLMGFCRSNDINLKTARLMKQAGFERVLIGIESANSKILKLFRKGESLETIRRTIVACRQAGISIVPGFMIFNPYTTISTLKADIIFLEIYGFTPILSKPLRIFDGTTIQGLMAAEGRLVWRSPLDGYHEYVVDPAIASIYMSLKTIAIDWIDLLRKTYQEEFWVIKKAPSFVERLMFDTLNKLVFQLERDFLKALISWTESGFCYRDVVRQIVRAKEQLICVEQFVASAADLARPRLKVRDFSVTDLAGKINSIMVNKVFYTFPEQYRWSDD